MAAKPNKPQISFQASFAPINSAILLLPHPRLTIEVPQSELGRAARLALWLKSRLLITFEMDGLEAVSFEARVPDIAAGYQCSAGDGIRFKLDLCSEFMGQAVELQVWGRGAFTVTIAPMIENNGNTTKDDQEDTGSKSGRQKSGSSKSRASTATLERR